MRLFQLDKKRRMSYLCDIYHDGWVGGGGWVKPVHITRTVFRKVFV